jgi:hypothetical protein
MHRSHRRPATVAVIVSLFVAGACARTSDPPNPLAESKPVATAEATAPVQSPTQTAEANGAAPSAGAGTQTPTQPAAATKTDEFKPVVGQAGKDVVWVPTPQPLVDRMLAMAKLTPNDIHYDLGSGDGRTVITAVKRGARSTGVEYNPDMVVLSKRLAQQEGVGEKAKFVEGDIFKTNFSDATVLTLFLLAELNVKLRPTILAMKPGTRVVSNTFKMGDWEPDESQTVTEKDGCTGYCTAHLWIVPAKVGGKWKLPTGELQLTQTYQRVSGTLGSNKVEGSLRGDQIDFVAGNARYTGKVTGNTVKGSVTRGSSTRPFTATRVSS